MRTVRGTRWFDSIVFWALIVASFLVYGEAMYRYGKIHGAVEVKPCPKVECLTAKKVRSVVFQTAKECRV